MHSDRQVIYEHGSLIRRQDKKDLKYIVHILSLITIDFCRNKNMRI